MAGPWARQVVRHSWRAREKNILIIYIVKYWQAV